MTRARNLSFLANVVSAGTNVVVGGGLSVSGIVTATSFVGDGTNLTNTGAVLSAGSGSQRIVLTGLTAGIMTTAATDVDLTYNSSTDTLSVGNLSVTTGFSTIGIASATRLFVSGVSTFSGISTFQDSLFGTRGSFAGIVTANSFRPSSGYYQSPNGTNAFYVFDTSGDVSFQGNIVTNYIRSNTNLSPTITVSDLDLQFARNVTVLGITTSGSFVSGVTSVTSLNVSGVSTFNNTLRVIPTSTSVAGIFSGTTSNDMVRITQLGTGNALVVEDEANRDTTPFVVTGSGKVGMGYSNPNPMLEINCANNFNAPTIAANTPTVFSDNTSDYGLILRVPFDNQGGDTAVALGFAQKSDRSVLGAGIFHSAYSGGDGSGDLIFATKTTSGSNQMIEKLRIRAGGNVGINTSAPTSKLTVVGSTNIYGDTTVSGNLNAPGNYFVKLARLTNQTILTGVDTLIGFTATSDTNGWYSGITTRTTPTVAGNYYVSAMVNWQAGATTNANQCNIQLRKNANTFAITIMGIQTFQYGQYVCGIVAMNGTTDYIDLTAYTSNATSQGITGDASGLYTKMEIFKLN